MLCSALSACGGGGGSAPAAPATPSTPAATELSLGAPPPKVLAGGQPVALSATLNGSGTVSWQLAAGSPGSLSASSGTSVNYQPPAEGTLYAPTTVTISASSGNLTKSMTLALAPPPGLSLIAGTLGGSGNLDGNGSAARLDGVTSMISDPSGNLYLASYRSLRKVSTDGTVSTLPASFPLQVPAVGADGTLYYFEMQSQGATIYWYNFKAQKADGSIVTIASPLQTAPAQIAVDRNNAIYLLYGYAEYSVIEQYRLDGSHRLYAGASGPASYADGAAAVARLYHPTDMLLDRSGNLIVLDGGNLRKVAPDGSISTVVAGRPQDPASHDNVLHNPSSLTQDRDGNLLVLDRLAPGAGYSIRRISGSTVTTPYHQSDPPLYPYSQDTAGFPQPDRMLAATGDGRLVVGNGAMLRLVNADGTLSNFAGLENDTGVLGVDGQGAAARYRHPGRLAADRDGNVYSVDMNWEQDNLYDAPARGTRAIIRKTTPAGLVSTVLDKELGMVTGLALDHAGRLYFTLSYSLWPDAGGAVYRLESNGQLTLIAGQAGRNDRPAQVDGSGSAARFLNVTDLAIDADDNLYVTEPASSAPGAPYPAPLRKIAPDGTVSTVAKLPASVNLASDGKRYEIYNNTIRRRNSDGSVETVLGKEGVAGTRLGPLGSAMLGRATSIVPAAPGTLAISVEGAILRLVLP